MLSNKLLSDKLLFDELEQTRVLAILHGATPAETVRWCERAWSLGVTLVEVPIRADGDLDLLAAAAEAGRRTGHPVGAGTVTSPELARQVAGLGAAFTVAPGLDEEVAAASAELGLAHLPGVATATEIQRALRLGLPWQKAFPASVARAGLVHAPAPPREPFRQVQVRRHRRRQHGERRLVPPGRRGRGQPGQRLRPLPRRRDPRPARLGPADPGLQGRRSLLNRGLLTEPRTITLASALTDNSRD